MCGIVGIRRFDGAPVHEAELRRMTAEIAHRGPDDEGYLVRGSVGFGHRRLSIIAVGNSAQPMSSPDGTTHLCFNGEILNYRELREQTPYPYRTGGDTEVLLSVFQSEGIEAVSKLRGQFAYAIYSEADDGLYLVRDRLGILPLYVYRDERMLAFASEIKALLAILPAPAVDLSSLGDYLARRSVPAPWTLFAGVSKLAPGTWLRIGADGAPPRSGTYWSVPTAGRASSPEPAHAAQELRERLRTSVARNLVADVPVGAYLSGGLDSSLIVALMREMGPSNEIQTFSASFGDPRFDESSHARRVAELFSTTHHEVHVRPGDFRELWPLLTWHRDGPVSEASDVAVYRLAQLAAQHVKVVLSGEGADELFGGYPKHRVAALARGVLALPPAVRGPLLRAVQERLPPRLARARIALRALSADSEAESVETWFAPFTGPERATLLRGVPEHDRRGDLDEHGDLLRRMLAADLQGWLPDNLLERGDRMSMAASLELRPPFLDSDLVQWAMALPSSVKVRRGKTKWLVRQVAHGYLPAEIFERPKIGFRVPLDEWFRGDLAGFVRDGLLSDDSFVADTLNRDQVAALVHRHMDRTADETLRIWTLLSLEMWHRVFFRGGVAAASV